MQFLINESSRKTIYCNMKDKEKKLKKRITRFIGSPIKQRFFFFYKVSGN